jgi:Icc-related predicted phosphoesterase
MCWRKFLNSPRFFHAQAAVMGGDITGKLIVPIRRLPDGTHRAQLQGAVRIARSANDVIELQAAIRHNGFYPWVASEAEVDRYEKDPSEVELLFKRILGDEIQRWVRMADERLDGSAQVFIMAGNDDPWFVDDALRKSERLVFCDRQVVPMGPYELVSLSYANRTPWASPRELDEQQLYSELHALMVKCADPAMAVLNVHVPPYDSGLDEASKLDADLRPVTMAGHAVPLPVGSTAVRQIIEETQPLLSLHGHIHESRGMTRIGRTVALNPGSRYNTGQLDGCIVDLVGDTVQSTRFIAG